MGDNGVARKDTDCWDERLVRDMEGETEWTRRVRQSGHRDTGTVVIEAFWEDSGDSDSVCENIAK